MQLGRTRFGERLFTVHSLYTFSFVSEISTCSVVSLVHSCYLRKLHFSTFYLRKFHISFFYLRKVVFFRLSQHFQLYLLIMFPHTGTQLYLLTMSFFPQPTNKQLLGARLTRIEEVTKFNKHKAIQQNI